MLLVLGMASATAAAAVAWHLQLAGYPLSLRMRRGAFTRFHAPQRMATAIMLIPLVSIDLVTSVGLLVLPAPDPLTGVFLQAGAASALLAVAVIRFVLRPAHRILASALDPRAFRRMLVGNCLRANLWGIHAMLLLIILVRAH